MAAVLTQGPPMVPMPGDIGQQAGYPGTAPLMPGSYPGGGRASIPKLQLQGMRQTMSGHPQPSDAAVARASYVADTIEIKPGVSRVTVKLPRPKVFGAPEFLDGAHRETIFAPCEANVTLGHQGSLKAEMGETKQWHNTYVYHYGSHGEDFSSRFQPVATDDPTPTYVDPTRAQQRKLYLERLEKENAEQEWREAQMLSGDSCALQPYKEKE